MLEEPCGDGPCACAAYLPNDYFTPGARCWIAGWGKYERYAQLSPKLLQTGLNPFSNEYCKSKRTHYRRYRFSLLKYHKLFLCSRRLQNTEFCAGFPDLDGDGLTDGGPDSCNGDSGSPLICDVKGQARLVGIVSWGPVTNYGPTCGKEGSPGVYSDVFKNEKWIRQTMDDIELNYNQEPTKPPFTRQSSTKPTNTNPPSTILSYTRPTFTRPTYTNPPPQPWSVCSSCDSNGFIQSQGCEWEGAVAARGRTRNEQKCAESCKSRYRKTCHAFSFYTETRRCILWTGLQQ